MSTWHKLARNLLACGVLAGMLAFWVPAAGGRDGSNPDGGNPPDITPPPDTPAGDDVGDGSAGADNTIPISPGAKSRLKIQPLSLKPGMKKPPKGTAATAAAGGDGVSLSAAALYRQELNTLGELQWKPRWEARELKVGESKEFKVTVARPPAAPGSTRGEMLTWITATLTGDGFDIQPLTRGEMLFDPGTTAQWRWSVKAKDAGPRRLALKGAYRVDIIAVYEGGAAEDPRFYDVVVKDSAADAFKKKVGALWAPVGGVLGALGTIIGFWLLITRVFKRKRAE